MTGYQGVFPDCDQGVFVAPGAWVIGAVAVGKDSSIFFNTVVRGDVNEITIGCRTNIQDNCTLHVTGTKSLHIGDGVTVGHNAVLHGCTIGNNVLIGMGAIVLDGACIEAESIVAAGSLVPPGKHYPAGSMIMGSPATPVRMVSDQEKKGIRTAAEHYIEVKDRYLVQFRTKQQGVNQTD